MKPSLKSLLRNNSEFQLSAIPCGFFLIVSILAIGRLFSLSANAWDLAVFDQYFWFLSRSELLTKSSFLGWSALADHLAFVLVPLSLFYRLFNTPIVLILLQSTFLSLSIFSVGYFAFHVERLSLHKSRFLQLAFSLSLPLWNAGINDFHTDSLFPVLIICLYYSLSRGGVGSTIIFLGLLLIVRDTGWFLALVTGAAYLPRTSTNGNRLPIFVILAALGWATISASLFYPLFYAEKYHHYSHYAHILHVLPPYTSASALIQALTVSNLLSSISWLGLIAAPFMFTCSLPRSTALIFAAFISSAPYVLSSEANHTNIIYHYGLSVVPFFALASASGFNASLVCGKKLNLYALQLFVAGLALVSHSLIAPNHLSAYKSMPEYISFMNYARALPADLKVMASNGLAALISNRKFVDFPLKHSMADPSAYHQFPQDFNYLILDQTNPGFGSSPDRNNELINQAIQARWTCSSRRVAHHNIVECVKPASN